MVRCVNEMLPVHDSPSTAFFERECYCHTSVRASYLPLLTSWMRELDEELRLDDWPEPIIHTVFHQFLRPAWNFLALLSSLPSFVTYTALLLFLSLSTPRQPPCFYLLLFIYLYIFIFSSHSSLLFIFFAAMWRPLHVADYGTVFSCLSWTEGQDIRGRLTC